MRPQLIGVCVSEPCTGSLTPGTATRVAGPGDNAATQSYRRPMDSIPDAIEQVASKQGGIITRQQALNAGLTEWALRKAVQAGRFESLRPGVLRWPGSPRDEKQRLWAAHLTVGPTSVVSHSSAARLWGLKAIEERRPTVTVPHRITPRNKLGLTVHRARSLQPTDIGTVDGLPVTLPARTMVDLAGETGKARLAAALDEAHYEKVVRYNEVGEALVRLGQPGRHGAVVLGDLLDARTGGRNLEQSVLERLLSDLFEVAGITDVVRQHPLPTRGYLDGLVDAFIRRGSVIAEGDGRTWHSRCADMIKDRQRELAAAEVGVQTLRFMHEQLTSDLEGCAEQLRRTVELRASQGLGWKAAA